MLEIMKLTSILRSKNWYAMNRQLLRYMDANAALLLSVLCDEYEYYATRNELTKDGYFFCTQEKIENLLFFKRRVQEAAFRALQDLEILTTKIKGVPAKRHVKFSENADDILVGMIMQNSTNCTNKNVQNVQTEMDKTYKQECTQAYKQECTETPYYIPRPEDKDLNTKEKQVFAHEENLQQPPTVEEVKEENAYTMGQAFAEAMRLEMQTRADGLASYTNANNTFRPNANTFLEKCVLNIAAAAQTCYRHENAKINLTPKVAQAYGSLLFNRFEMLCENGNGTNRNLHTQTTFQQTLMQLSQYCEAFICDVLSEATMGGWETPKTDAAILADKYNKWLYTHKQTENLTKVRQQVESADKAAKNAFSVAIGVLEDKEIDMVNKAAKASKVNKRSVAADLKAATRRAYAAVMYMRTKDAIYNSSVDANGIPMGMEAERTGDAVYTAAYEIIKGNYKNW
jgi:hypothetical protein